MAQVPDTDGLGVIYLNLVFCRPELMWLHNHAPARFIGV